MARNERRKIMKISFIGTGVFSLAVAINLAQNKDNKIMME